MRIRDWFFATASVALCAGPTVGWSSEEEIIRALREASNQAIARHETAPLRQTWVEDLNVSASNGEVFSSGEQMEAAFARSFSDPEFVTYRRTPSRISISQRGSFAAEQGEWVGIWRKEDGEMRVRGPYLAQWQKRAEGWRIRSELYVALTCEGSRDCTSRP